jgi:lipopolysaccharide O-acetyltransferase
MVTQYGLMGLLKLSYYKIRTYLLFQKRDKRFPLILEGAEFIVIELVLLLVLVVVWSYIPLKLRRYFFGKNVQLNDYVHITAMERVRK